MISSFTFLILQKSFKTSSFKKRQIVLPCVLCPYFLLGFSLPAYSLLTPNLSLPIHSFLKKKIKFNLNKMLIIIHVPAKRSWKKWDFLKIVIFSLLVLLLPYQLMIPYIYCRVLEVFHLPPLSGMRFAQHFHSFQIL